MKLKLGSKFRDKNGTFAFILFSMIRGKEITVIIGSKTHKKIG